MNKQKAIKEFEYMRNMAELRALSNISLERPLTNDEFNRMMELKDKVLWGDLNVPKNRRTNPRGRKDKKGNQYRQLKQYDKNVADSKGVLCLVWKKRNT